jgi:hypothetical protein
LPSQRSSPCHTIDRGSDFADGSSGQISADAGYVGQVGELIGVGGCWV